MNKFILNEQIKSQTVRVLDEEGEMLGVMNTADALAKASEQGIDLIVINDAAEPPVCKLIEYGRFKYQQQKLEKERQRKAKENAVLVKEIQLRPVTDSHDIQIKAKQTKSFFADGHKVKATVRFKGREMSHQTMGQEVLNEFLENLGDTYTVDAPPSMTGSKLQVILMAKK